MHKKFTPLLDDKLLSRAKVYTKKKHKTLSRVLEEALQEYLRKKDYPTSSFSSVEASFGALKISPRNLRHILKDV